MSHMHSSLWLRGWKFSALLLLLAPFAAIAEESINYHSLSLTQAAQLIREKKITSTALVEALLQEAEAARNANAFITLDREGALKAARAADAAQQQGRILGPLHGVPLVIKDNIHVANLPNTAGTPALRNFVPRENAPVVQSLLDAGAIVLGKANMHELAFGATSNNATFGAVHNPYDPARFPGGSSGGTAAAIAAGIAPGGLGTDTGGSVRIPAALTGLVGLRPTSGRYSLEGVTPFSHTRDTVGPLARTVADVVLLDQVISGDMSAVQPADIKKVRLGVARNAFYSNLDPEVARIMARTLEQLRSAGAELVELDLDDFVATSGKIGATVGYFEIKSDLTAYLAKYQTGVSLTELAEKIASPDVKNLFDKNVLGEKAPTAAAYQEAMEHYRPKLQQLYTHAFTGSRIDALIFPTTPMPAQLIENSTEVTLNGKKMSTLLVFVANTRPINNAGIAGLSIPMGMTVDGLPVGVEIDGPADSDRRLLAIGLQMEKILGPVPPPKR
jgi:Asp-tRNA(Asn)/Glu-tRNA(Gln) amidotransferase A subunit family amidase